MRAKLEECEEPDTRSSESFTPQERKAVATVPAFGHRHRHSEPSPPYCIQAMIMAHARGGLAAVASTTASAGGIRDQTNETLLKSMHPLLHISCPVPFSLTGGTPLRVPHPFFFSFSFSFLNLTDEQHTPSAKQASYHLAFTDRGLAVLFHASRRSASSTDMTTDRLTN